MAAEQIEELTREEIVQLIEQHAHARRGVSAEALVRQYRRRVLESPGEVADLLALADLLPDDDPLFDGTGRR